MTAMTATYKSRRSPGGFFVVLALVTLAIGAGLLLARVGNGNYHSHTPQELGEGEKGWGEVTFHAHAAESHFEEAWAIRNCLKNNGPFMTYSVKADNHFHLFCHLPDGRVGMQIVTDAGDEVTAFIKGNGVWKDIKMWIDRIGTPFKGKLPWLK